MRMKMNMYRKDLVSVLIFSLILCALPFTITANEQDPTAPVQSLIAGMNNLTFSDDFDSPDTFDLNGTHATGYNWYLDRPFGWSSASSQDLTISNSVLTVKSQQPFMGWGVSTYTTTGDTGYKYQYGYAEAKMKFSIDPQIVASADYFPCFWGFSWAHTTLRNSTRWGEIDYFEAMAGGSTPYVGQYLGTVHDHSADPSQHVQNANHYIDNVVRDNGWHTYGCLWTQDKIEWYFDNQLLIRVDYGNDGPYSILRQEQMVLILGGSSQWPAEVDYVRVWQQGNMDGITIPDYKEPGNLLANPGFEHDSSDWMYYNYGGITTETAHTGSRSMKLLGTGGQWWGPQQIVPVQRNTNYTLSFYAKAQANATVKVLDSNGNPIIGQFNVTPSDNWTLYSQTFNSGNNDTFNVFIMNHYTDGSASYFDDFVLSDGTTGTTTNTATTNTTVTTTTATTTTTGTTGTTDPVPSGNLVQNGDFSQPKSSGYWADGANAGGFVIDTSGHYLQMGYYNGTEITVNDGYVHQTVSVQPNTDYVFSVDVGMNTDDRAGKIKLRGVQNSVDYVYKELKPSNWDWNPVNGWCTYTWEINSGSNTSLDIQLYDWVYSRNSNNYVRYANISLASGDSSTSTTSAPATTFTTTATSTTTTTGTTQPPLSGNLVQNGDFMQPKSAGYWVDGANAGGFVIDTNNHYLQMGFYDGTEITVNDGFVHQIVTVEPNTDYVFSVDVGMNTNDRAGKIKLRGVQNSVDYVYKELKPSNSDWNPVNGWCTYTWEVNSGGNSSLDIQLYDWLYSRSASNYVRYTNISITKGQFNSKRKNRRHMAL